MLKPDSKREVSTCFFEKTRYDYGQRDLREA